jgi:adenosylmethionine-8-amino-7-oxononanoate aminotransferase
MSILNDDLNYTWHPFTQEKTASKRVVITKGEGIWLYDDNNNKYMDLISSWWVNIHGHANKHISNAITAQLQKLEHVIFTDFTHEPAAKLAKNLCNILPKNLNRVFFSDNGSSAVEISLKMAYQYWKNLNIDKTKFLTLSGGYHGDTIGAMSVGKSSRFFTKFSDLLFETTSIPYPETFINDDAREQKEENSLKELDKYLQTHGKQTAAIILEPLIQGASGMRVASNDFVKKLIHKCRKYEILIIFDEIMTGFGRTGSMFACTKLNEIPDIICLSKGLTGGFVPMSVAVATNDIYKAFLSDDFDNAFIHGHSYTANPIGCTAALASLELFDMENTIENVHKIEKIHKERILDIFKKTKCTKPRVLGSIAAINLPSKQTGYLAKIGQEFKKLAWDNNMLLRPLGDVLYLMPPLSIAENELNTAYDKIEQILEQIGA